MTPQQALDQIRGLIRITQQQLATVLSIAASAGVPGVSPFGNFPTPGDADLPAGLVLRPDGTYQYGERYPLPIGTTLEQALDYVRRVDAQYGGHPDYAAETADDPGVGFKVMSQDEQNAIASPEFIAQLQAGDFAAWQSMLTMPNEDLVRQVLQNHGMKHAAIKDSLAWADASRGQGKWNAR